MFKKAVGITYLKLVSWWWHHRAAASAALVFVVLTFLNHLSFIVDTVGTYAASVGIELTPFGLADDLMVAVLAWFVYIYLAKIEPTRPRLQLTPRAVEEALDEGRVEVIIQPVYRIQTNTVVGFESLVRLHHPTFGVIRPHEFINHIAFSGSSAAKRLTAMVIDQTADYYRRFRKDGYDFHMTINLFYGDLLDASTRQVVTTALNTHDMPADRMIIEISEHMLASNSVVNIVKMINSMANVGVRLSLDDCGLQPTSFGHAKALHVDYVKMDAKLIEMSELSEYNKELIRSVIHSAHSIGVAVVAKHVEHQQTVAMLRQVECDFIQGYVLAPPMTYEQAREWIKIRKTARVSI